MERRECLNKSEGESKTHAKSKTTKTLQLLLYAENYQYNFPFSS